MNRILYFILMLSTLSLCVASNTDNFSLDLDITSENPKRKNEEFFPLEPKKVYFYRLQKEEPNAQPIYLLGSAHCVPPDVLPDIVRQTFSRCGNYITECLSPYEPNYFEVHLTHMKNQGYTVTPEILVQRDIKIKNMIFYNKMYEQEYWAEQTGKYSLGWSTFLKNQDILKQFMKDHALTLEMINGIDPNVFYQGVIQTYNRWKVEKNGMDNYFLNEAKHQNKISMELESELDRINLFYKGVINENISTVPIESTLQFIDEGLEDIFKEDLQKIAEKVNECTHLYISGDIEKYLNLEAYATGERNNIWVNKLANLTGPSFGCVGLNHLLGDKGILALMQEKGYHVTQVTSQGF